MLCLVIHIGSIYFVEVAPTYRWQSVLWVASFLGHPKSQTRTPARECHIFALAITTPQVIRSSVVLHQYIFCSVNKKSLPCHSRSEFQINSHIPLTNHISIHTYKSIHTFPLHSGPNNNISLTAPTFSSSSSQDPMSRGSCSPKFNRKTR
jgi:hypothetical protein